MFEMFMRAVPLAMFFLLRMQSRRGSARSTLGRRGYSSCSYSGSLRLAFLACERDAAASSREGRGFGERSATQTNIRELHARWALVSFFFFANSWQRKIASQIFSMCSSASVE